MEGLWLFISYLEWQRYVIKMSKYFSEPYERSGGNLEVELNLSHYATNADLKEATGINTSKPEAKTDLASSKNKSRQIRWR